MEYNSGSRAFTEFSSCQAYEFSWWGTSEAKSSLVGLGACPQKSLKSRGPEMPFPKGIPSKKAVNIKSRQVFYKNTYGLVMSYKQHYYEAFVKH